MARIRTIKPEFWDDLKISKISRDARLLYIGMWNFADDLGVIIGDHVWLKSKVFPFDNIQHQQFDKWIEVLVQSGFISLLSYNEERFYYLPNLTRHQVINKPNYDRVNIKQSDLQEIINSRNDTGMIPDASHSGKEGKGKEGKGKEEERITPNGVVELWNSTCLSLPSVSKLTDSRQRKIKTRLAEMGKTAEEQENALRALFEKIQGTPFLKGDNDRQWKASFDWVFENDKNWIKVMEGAYEKKHGSAIGNRFGLAQ